MAKGLLPSRAVPSFHQLMKYKWNKLEKEIASIPVLMQSVFVMRHKSIHPDLAIYTTEELAEAYAFYLKGPFKENRQLADMMERIRFVLCNERESLGNEHDAFLDSLFAQFDLATAK